MPQPTLFLKPKEGLIVKDPVTRQPLPKEGAQKPRNSYWQRRVKDGDAIVCDKPAPSATSQTTPAAPTPAQKGA